MGGGRRDSSGDNYGVRDHGNNGQSANEHTSTDAPGKVTKSASTAGARKGGSPSGGAIGQAIREAVQTWVGGPGKK